jgi:TolA-binding protein
LVCLVAGAWTGGAWAAVPRKAPSASAAANVEADAQIEASGEGAAAGTTEAPAPISPEIEALVREREGHVAQVRREGIKLLEDFLKISADRRETAEALFKLAELTWEEAQARYLDGMGLYQAAVEACREDRNRCRQVPRERPRLDLSRAQGVYRRLIDEFPRFRKIDTVLYLYAFSLREQGRISEAITYFMRILREFPRSRFRADAWMAVGEYRFYEDQDFPGALRAYDNVVKFPSSQLYGLALFKSAWCYWKLGQGDRAAQRFKDVLDLAERAKTQGERERKRAAELQDQALDYLVELFTEDDTKSAQDAFEFLVQIGGKAYSVRVLERLANTVYDQTRYERAAEAYLFLLTLAPDAANAPDHQIRVVESFQSLGKNDRASAEMRKLAVKYGPGSAWARANADRPKTVARARAKAEEFIRVQAKTLHAAAQRTEKDNKVIDKALYGQAAESYGFYLQQFPDASDAQELRFLRAQILGLKLGQYREAGDEYLTIGRSKPVGPHHKESLLNAMNAFEKLRPPAPRTAEEKRARKVTDDDRKFAEAADLYAEILPDDKEIVVVIYKNGQFFFDYGDHDEAVKRFGLILERYPDDPNAGAAGDRLLEAVAEAKDYDNIENWARRLKKVKAFAGRDEQKRLNELIVGSMMKTGDKLVAEKKFEEAARKYASVADEGAGPAQAGTAMFNAAAAWEKAGRPGEAVKAYEDLAEKHPQSEKAPEGLFIAAQIEESIANYAGAAVLYERIGNGFERAPKAGPALKNAGILRRTLGQHDRAAAHFAAYEKRYRGSAEAKDVAFERGVLLEEKKDGRQAAAAFGEFVRLYPEDPRLCEALVRQARANLEAGADAKASEALERALNAYRKGKGGGKEAAYHAAEARYLEGEIIYRQYERVKIEGKPRQLAKSLEKKASLLDDAKKVYLDVLSFKSPEWATAALLRIGQGYATFAKAIRDTPVPKQLSPDEAEVYREELAQSVIVIEEKSLDAYRTGYAKAIDIGVYNQHTKELREGLAELDAGQFPPEVEERLGPRLGERHASLTPLEEIRRD